MGKIDESLEAENTRAAFDRMYRTKNSIDRVVRAGAVLHLGQPSLDLLERFAALVEEGQLQLIQTRHDLLPSTKTCKNYGATLRTVAIRLSGSNGLTIQPVAPAWRARF